MMVASGMSMDVGSNLARSARAQRVPGKKPPVQNLSIHDKVIRQDPTRRVGKIKGLGDLLTVGQAVRMRPSFVSVLWDSRRNLTLLELAVRWPLAFPTDGGVPHLFSIFLSHSHDLVSQTRFVNAFENGRKLC
jgi:hypothetical protein